MSWRNVTISLILGLPGVNPSLGTVLFILEAKNKKGNVLYYLWNGPEDTVWYFVQETSLNIKNEIRQQGTMDTRGR